LIVVPRSSIESTISNRCHALGDGDVGEAAAIIESLASNVRQLWVLWSVNGSKAAAPIESRFSNARYTLWDVDGSEILAFIESLVSNTRYISTIL
jgi:hypothetical protein